MGSCNCPAKYYDDGINVACVACPVTCDICKLYNGILGCTTCTIGINLNRFKSPVNNKCPCFDGYF